MCVLLLVDVVGDCFSDFIIVCDRFARETPRRKNTIWMFKFFAFPAIARARHVLRSECFFWLKLMALNSSHKNMVKISTEVE